MNLLNILQTLMTPAKPAEDLWFNKSVIIYQDKALIVRMFREPLEGFHNTLVVPPQAGHESWIASFDKDQSLIGCCKKYTKGGVFAIDYIGADLSRTLENEKDLQSQILTAIGSTGSKAAVHVVGLCQGGWASAMTATSAPESIDLLTIAGTPIDTSFESILTPAQKMPISVYDLMIASGGGLVHGDWMLENWMKPDLKAHKAADKLPENARFYKWYYNTQNLASGWYRWAIENIFIGNKLPEILDIKCKVMVVVGDKDPITPPEQTIAIENNCDGPVSVHRTPGGHLGVFMGTRAINEVWPKVFEEACEHFGEL